MLLKDFSFKSESREYLVAATIHNSFKMIEHIFSFNDKEVNKHSVLLSGGEKKKSKLIRQVCVFSWFWRSRPGASSQTNMFCL